MQDDVVSDGRYVRGPESMHAAYPLRMSARDLARFGLLYVDPSNGLVVVHQTERGKVSERQMGQLMRMILAAAPRQGSTG